jgi:hypothetical protein
MKLSLEEKTKLIILSERASELLVEILAEENPKERIQTEMDAKFHKTMAQMNYHCPALSDEYIKMYNKIQEIKAKEDGATYLKRLRKQDFGKEEYQEPDIIY